MRSDRENRVESRHLSIFFRPNDSGYGRVFDTFDKAGWPSPSINYFPTLQRSVNFWRIFQNFTKFRRKSGHSLWSKKFINCKYVWAQNLNLNSRRPKLTKYGTQQILRKLEVFEKKIWKWPIFGNFSRNFRTGFCRVVRLLSQLRRPCATVLCAWTSSNSREIFSLLAQTVNYRWIFARTYPQNFANVSRLKLSISPNHHVRFSN